MTKTIQKKTMTELFNDAEVIRQKLIALRTQTGLATEESHPLMIEHRLIYKKINRLHNVSIKNGTRNQSTNLNI